MSVLLARFQRWVYLLFLGMWRGECAMQTRDNKGLCVLGTVGYGATYIRSGSAAHDPRSTLSGGGMMTRRPTFLTSVPEEAGKVVGIATFRGRVIVAAEYRVYELRDKRLRLIKFVQPCEPSRSPKPRRS
jgi:hypothetical protein